MSDTQLQLKDMTPGVMDFYRHRRETEASDGPATLRSAEQPPP
jgi:hypothetical protein